MDAAAAAVARRLPACLENMLHGRPGVHVPALPPPLPPLPASVASNRAMASVQQPRAACCWSHRSWPPHRPAWWRGRGPPGPPAGGWLDPSPPHPCPVANQRGRTRAREYGGGRGWSRDRYLRRPPPRAALGWVWCGRGLGRHGVRVRLGIQGRARRLRHPPGGVSSGTTAWLGSAALPAPGPCPRLGPPGTLPRVVLNRRVVTCPHARPTRAAQLESEQRGVPSRQPPPYGVGMAARAARTKVHPGGASWRELQPRPSDHCFTTCHWNWQDDTPYLPLLIFGGGVCVFIFHLMKKSTCASSIIPCYSFSLPSFSVTFKPGRPVTVSQSATVKDKQVRVEHPCLVLVAASGAHGHALDHVKNVRNFQSCDLPTFSSRPRAPAFRALKNSEKNGSNIRWHLTTPGRFWWRRAGRGHGMA